MGLDFGFATMNKKLYNFFSFDNEDSFYAWLYDEDHEDALDYIYNNCGWGNVAASWCTFGLGFNDQHLKGGVVKKALTRQDIFNVILNATEWYDHNVDLKPVVMGRAFKENEDDSITLVPFDGIEVMDEDQAYHRFYCEDSDERLMLTKMPINMWDMYRYIQFIKDMMQILSTVDWDNDVLLFYYSY